MKDNINLPPFYVGQRVVALNNSSNGARVKDNVYVVKGLKRCGCGRWLIDIGDVGELAITQCKCGRHDFVFAVNEWHYADAFAPIESTFSAITLSEVIEIETPLICSN